MTTTWVAIAVLAAGSYALKLFGYLVSDRVLDHPVINRAVVMVPVALLSALTAVQVFGSGRDVVVDARVVGLAFAVVALLFRVPFLLVVIGSGAVTALTRAIA